MKICMLIGIVRLNSVSVRKSSSGIYSGSLPPRLIVRIGHL